LRLLYPIGWALALDPFEPALHLTLETSCICYYNFMLIITW
jgi:hypothetical protein